MQVQSTGEVEEHFEMSDGFNLFCRHWYPSGEVKGVVIFLHGIEVHSGSFRFIGHQLQEAGFESFAIDRRGSGNSKEPNLPRGDTMILTGHLADLGEFVDVLRASIDKKLWLFLATASDAHTRYGMQPINRKIDGLVLALLLLKMALSCLQWILSKWFFRQLFPLIQRMI